MCKTSLLSLLQNIIFDISHSINIHYSYIHNIFVMLGHGGSVISNILANQKMLSTILGKFGKNEIIKFVRLIPL